jgi:hypothetical protein
MVSVITNYSKFEVLTMIRFLLQDGRNSEKVIRFFSGHTMALVLTQPLTEMNARNILVG